MANEGRGQSKLALSVFESVDVYYWGWFSCGHCLVR